MKGVPVLWEVKHFLRCFVFLLYCGWQYFYLGWTLCVGAHHRSQLSHCVWRDGKPDCAELKTCMASGNFPGWYEPGYLELGKVNPFLWCSELSITAADTMHQCNAVIFHSFTPNPFFILSGLEWAQFWQSLFVTQWSFLESTPKVVGEPQEQQGCIPVVSSRGWEPGIRSWVHIVLPYQVEKNHINIFYVLMSCMLWRAI